jgi:hypothetical protein
MCMYSFTLKFEDYLTIVFTNKLYPDISLKIISFLVDDNINDY